MDGDKIVNISNYHSIESTREGMKLWRYYGIRSGNFQLFSKNWSFQSGLKVVTHFTKCADNIEPTTAEAKNPELTKQRKHKQHNDHQLCNLNFRTVAHCCAIFETFDELESHIVKGIHSVPKAALSFDYVKKSFANQMIVAARFLFICNILSNSFSFQCIYCFFNKDGVYLSGQHFDSMLLKNLFSSRYLKMERQLGKRKAQKKSIWP